MGFWACSSPTSPGASGTANTPIAPDSPAVTGKYALTYHGNGNTWGTAPIENSSATESNTVFTIQDRGDLYRVGYHFTGWNTTAEGNGTNFAAGAELSMDEGISDLYAQWEEVFPFITAGDRFSILSTKSGNLYSSGFNVSGRLGNGTNHQRSNFGFVGNDDLRGVVKKASAGTDHSFAILQDGSVRGWGMGISGKLGTAEEHVFYLPIHPKFTNDGNSANVFPIADISPGRTQTAILTENGEYWAAGTKEYGALGNGSNGQAYQQSFEKVSDNVLSLAAGHNYVMVIKKDGTLHAAGTTEDYRSGTKDRITKGLTLIKDAGNDNVRVFTGKHNHTMLLKADGRLMAAGNNVYGQLGVGKPEGQYLFSPVIDSNGNPLTGVASVSMGETHSMILKNDGTLWAAGNNSHYQLGIDQRDTQNKAVMVLEKVARVAAGTTHTLAVTEDGKLWGAGSNFHGQFGGDVETPAYTYTWTEIDISSVS
jgi:uncharacterized repeat protein (TIGR02543 family)